MTCIVIPAADYLYLCRFSGREEARHYLNGVFIDTANRRMVATDGHRLGLLDVRDTMVGDGPSRIITNSKAMMAACKAARREVLYIRCYDDRCEVVDGANATAEEIHAGEGRTMIQVPAMSAYVDGTFPDYDRVIPDSVSGLTTETAKGIDGQPGETTAYGYNSEYLADFCGPEKKDAGISLVPNGGSPALVFNTDPRFLGVFMPMRSGVTPADAIERRNAIMSREPEAAKNAA